MTDAIDQAQAAQLAAIEAANQRRTIREGLHECEQCGAPIDERRRVEFGARLCMPHQRAREQADARRRKGWR